MISRCQWTLVNYWPIHLIENYQLLFEVGNYNMNYQL
jgi:hypothetical protein